MRDLHRASWSPEEALRLDAAIMADTRDAVIITDLSSRILDVNPAFTEITGYGEEEVLGENPRLLKSGRHDCAFYQAMWTTLLETGHWQGEIWNRRKDGDIYPEWLTLTTVRNEQGEPAYYLGVATDLSQLRRHEERLQRLVHYDPLTGLPNRLLLEARLQHALEHAGRGGNLAAVLVIDLDHFKLINDSFGHAEGDALLIAVSSRLQARLRKEDTLSRLAGDQFVLVLESLHEHQESEVVVRGIQAALEAPFILSDGDKIYVQVSIGISVYPQDGVTAQALLVGADAAVHRAKKLGGRQFCYYSSEFNVQARATLAIEEALRRALAQEEFVLYYQPKLDLRSGRITGAEALLRWLRPGFGMVPPLQFIPAAEKNGLIEAIGTWVIRDACRQISAWREAGLAGVKVAVNVSAYQFRCGGLEEVVAEALARYGVEPRQLMLELTESMLMEEPEEAVARMTALKRIGVSLSLDDFGTGYSSLAYLSRFPIDQMKIDCSFVNGIISDPGAATIATSIIALAHRMRLGVVAEGVETEAQAGYLRQNGCDEIQGYLFSKAVPAEAFAELLRQGKKLPLPPEAPRQSRTLLIVDDEPHVLAALQRMLDNEGYLVLAAADGREGLEFLAKNQVQVILSDQRMPGMSGTEFFQRVKELHPDTVRMILSGYADLETVVEAVNEGAIYKFFSKPWNVEQLRIQIRDAFLYHEGVIAPQRRAASEQ
jgi:diguanylate cyclase (GGDEF)-like protein/PAS domain S-box-containing protein